MRLLVCFSCEDKGEGCHGARGHGDAGAMTACSRMRSRSSSGNEAFNEAGGILLLACLVAVE